MEEEKLAKCEFRVIVTVKSDNSTATNKNKFSVACEFKR